MIKSDNYTYINPITLEAEFPQEENDGVLRPVEQFLLRERTSEEMAKLRNHPFFKDDDIRLTTKKFLIIAKDTKDARLWATKNSIRPKDYKYASSPRSIEGVANMQVVFTGDADKHRYYAQIMDMIHMCFGTGHLEVINNVCWRQ